MPRAIPIRADPVWQLSRDDRLRVGEVSRGEKMLDSGTDPESYITEYTVVYEDKRRRASPAAVGRSCALPCTARPLEPRALGVEGRGGRKVVSERGAT